MVVKDVEYSRRFKAKDVGFDEGEFLKSHNRHEEDKRILDLVKRKFSLKNYSEGCSGFFGSDGTFNYLFRLCYENVNTNDYSYDSIAQIRKSGALEKIDELSDLEKELAKQGFVKK